MQGKNTRFRYLYRDAANYKMPNEVILKGTLTEKEIEEIRSVCEAEEYFIPRQVGLPEKRFDERDDEVDHCWFEIPEYAFETTDKTETIDMSAQDLLEAFRKVDREDVWHGWEDGWEDVV